MAIYESYYQHLAITDEYLEQHILFESKKMRLTDIKTVKHFEGDYIIKTDTNQININSKLLSKDSLEQLIHRLKTLEVEWI